MSIIPFDREKEMQVTGYVSTFEPITSVIVGILVYGEPMTLRIFIGCAAIIVSTLIIARTESKE